MNTGDGILRRILVASAPLVLWAAHFALMYLLAVLHAGRAVMIVLSLLALGGAAVLLWRARGGEPRSLQRLAMAANAVLATIAIAWTSLPLILLD